MILIQISTFSQDFHDRILVCELWHLVGSSDFTIHSLTYKNLYEPVLRYNSHYFFVICICFIIYGEIKFGHTFLSK